MDDKSKRSWVTTAVVGVLVVLALLLVVAWMNDDNGDDLNQIDNETAVEETTEDESLLTQITEEPDAFIGETVTLTAEVQDVYSNRVFTISGDTVGDELLVVTPQALSEEQAAQAEEFLADNANVEVSGQVVRLTVAEIERDFGLELDPEVETEFENRPIIVAERITFTDQSDAFWDFSDETAGNEE